MEITIDFFLKTVGYLISLLIALIVIIYNFILKNQDLKIDSKVRGVILPLEKKIEELEDEISSLKRHNKKDNENTQIVMERLITKLDQKQPDILNEII